MRAFLSYSHRDSDVVDLLKTHFRQLTRDNLAEFWHDREILPGNSFDTEISEQLEASDLFLLVITPHFIASDHCMDHEMPYAIERHGNGDATVVPIIVDPCDWKSIKPLADLKALPRDGRPISEWENEHTALNDVTQELRRLLLNTETVKRSDDPVVSNHGTSGFSNTALNPQFTFENFVVGRPNELAFSTARSISEDKDNKALMPFGIYGATGCGASHLLIAMAHHIQSTRPGVSILYLPADHFLDGFERALRDQSLLEYRESLQALDVLLFDDIQLIANHREAKKEFFRIFDDLMRNGSQVIFAAGEKPADIHGLDERETSRLQSGLLAQLGSTDYELRLGVLHYKLEALVGEFGGVEIEGGVLEFLAHRCASNVRVLEGTIKRGLALAKLVGRPLSVELANECMAEHLAS